MGRMVMRPSDREIASQFSALLDRHFHFADVGTTEAFIDSSKIILNGIANVLASLPARFLLETNNREARGNSPRNLLPTYEARSDIGGSSQNFIS